MYLSSYCIVGFEVLATNAVTIYSLLINGCPKQASLSKNNNYFLIVHAVG